jgi:hypothetical protein
MAEKSKAGTQDTGMLQLESLQLDIIKLRHDGEDRQEFTEFSTKVKANFESIQKNFTSIQANFDRLFQSVKVREDEIHQTGSSHPQTPPNANILSATSVCIPPPPQAIKHTRMHAHIQLLLALAL